jgi:hypothetical protein
VGLSARLDQVQHRIRDDRGLSVVARGGLHGIARLRALDANPDFEPGDAVVERERGHIANNPSTLERAFAVAEEPQTWQEHAEREIGPLGAHEKRYTSGAQVDDRLEPLLATRQLHENERVATEAGALELTAILILRLGHAQQPLNREGTSYHDLAAGQGSAIQRPAQVVRGNENDRA